MKRRVARATVILVLALIAIGQSGGCSFLSSSDTESGEEGGGLGEVAAPSLAEFLDADSKSGDYEAHTDWGNGESYDQTGQFWVDGRMFRYDIYEDGTLARSVISPDGDTAYFVFYDEEICEPSVASVDYYLARYSMPSDGGAEDGVDEDSGATRVVYTVKKTDTMPGSANSWYSEDVTYLVKDDVVIGVITRGAVPEDDGTLPELDVNRELWSNVKAGMPIPAETFELPYPVRDAE